MPTDHNMVIRPHLCRFRRTMRGIPLRMTGPVMSRINAHFLAIREYQTNSRTVRLIYSSLFTDHPLYRIAVPNPEIMVATNQI